MKWAFGHTVAAIGAVAGIGGDAGIMLAMFIFFFYMMVGLWLDAYNMFSSDGEDDDGANWWETPEQAKRRKKLRKNGHSDF
jgi:hypothetical protein